MKLLNIRICLTIAVVAMASLLCSDANAQQAWTPDYSPSCSEGGGCRHADDSLQLIPYGQNYGYENEIGSVRIPYRDSCLLYTSPSPRDATLSRMPSSA